MVVLANASTCSRVANHEEGRINVGQLVGSVGTSSGDLAAAANSHQQRGIEFRAVQSRRFGVQRHLPMDLGRLAGDSCTSRLVRVVEANSKRMYAHPN